jgi:hypothetical protein
VDVQPNLSVAGFPGVYALGDSAKFKATTGEALPQLASVAQQAGRHCARNIIAAVSGEPEQPFQYRDKGIMAMVGRKAALAELGSHRHAVKGILAFAAWLGVHVLLLTTVRAKIETFMEWGGDTSEMFISIPSLIVPMLTGPAKSVLRPLPKSLERVDQRTRRKKVPSNKRIERIAIVGTGGIGASWAACYLSRGFDVIATDPEPSAEANLRKYEQDSNSTNPEKECGFSRCCSSL